MEEIITLFDGLEEKTPAPVAMIVTLLSCLGRGTKASFDGEMAKKSSTVSFDSFARAILFLKLA